MRARICIQSDLLAIVQWAKSNNMMLNEDKIDLVNFGKEKVPHGSPSDDPLVSSNNSRDLGVIVDNKRHWSTHVNSKAHLFPLDVLLNLENFLI